MRLKTAIISALILIFGSTAFAQAAPDPEETVRAFYKYSNARSSTFNRRHIESRKQWYTPALYNAFWTQLRKDQAYLKKNPTDKPFFGDGLDFMPLDEPCDANGKSYRRSWSISRRDIRKTRAYIDVKFAYPKACNLESEYYRVNLQKIGGKWLISDWTYSDGSTLTGDMRKHNY